MKRLLLVEDNRDLAQRHGGRAFAVEAEGGGARVGVELPAVEEGK